MGAGSSVYGGGLVFNHRENISQSLEKVIRFPYLGSSRIEESGRTIRDGSCVAGSLSEVGQMALNFGPEWLVQQI